MKKTNRLNKKLREDLEFSKRIRKDWKDYEKGKFISSNAEDFLKEMKKW